MLYIILYKEIQKEKEGENSDFVLLQKIFFEKEREGQGKGLRLLGGLGEFSFQQLYNNVCYLIILNYRINFKKLKYTFKLEF